MTKTAFRDVLEAQAARIDVAVPPAILDACAVHFDLMVRWNATHNLTRVVDPTEAAIRHYLDCLVPALAWTAAGLPTPTSFLDIGSGAGFPGLIAALVWPGVEAGLVEPARKRASFLNIAAGAMGIKARVQSPGSQTSSLVLSRATFSAGVHETLWPYVVPGGRVVVWSTSHELDTWRESVSTWKDASLSAVPYRLPGVDDRLLVVVERGVQR